MKTTKLQLKLSIQATISVLLLVVFGTIVSAQTTAPKPISKDGLMKAVQIGGLSSQELSGLISSMGVDFRLSDEERDGLLKSGLERTVVDAIIANYHMPEPPKPTAAELAAAKVLQLSNGGPLTQEELTNHLKTGVAPAILEQVVDKRGISFSVTADTAKSVESAGGNRSLLGVLILKQPAAVVVQEVKQQQTVQQAAAIPAAPVAVPVTTNLPQAKNIEQATLLKREALNYPLLARKEKIAGNVRCEVYIDDKGSVSKVKTVSGHPVLAAAAEESIRKWKYNPAKLDGKSVSSSTLVEVNFKPVSN